MFRRVASLLSCLTIATTLSPLLLIVALPSDALAVVNHTYAATADEIARYTVEITPDLISQHEVRVKASLAPKGTLELTVSSLGGPQGEAQEPQILIEGCHDQTGKPISIERINAQTWRLSSSTEVTIEYRANVNIVAPMTAGAYLAYLGDKCGLLYAGSILLAPTARGMATVSFVLPEEWTVITDETWVPVGSAEYQVNIADFDALIAPGEWEVFDDTFGDGQKLRVAICGETRYPRGDYLKNMKVCLDYFHEKIGRLPQQEMNVVVAPLPLPVDYMSGTPRLAVTRAVKSGPGSDWGMFEGMFWHYWFLKPVRYESQHDSDQAWWFGEGVSPFFLYPVYEKIGAASDVAQACDFPRKELSWQNWYSIYESYRGTKYDIPLVDYPAKSRETGDVKFYFPLPYMKSSLVLELLNESIHEASGGESDIASVVSCLYENYVLPGKGYTVEDILQVANKIAGSDYKAFFDAYVYGNEKLPVSTVGKDYAIDWLTLGEKLYPSLPNTEMAVPKHVSAPVTLELKKESGNFAVYFHPQDERMALLLLLRAQRASSTVARVFGGNPPLKIRMFMTYDREEAIKFGYNPPGGIPQGASGGGPSSEAGDELIWLNPIRRDDTQITTNVMAHELGHCFMRQLYPGIYFTGIEDLSEVDEFVSKGLYNKNWLSWFSEGIADYADIECWLEAAADTPGPLPKAQDAFQQLVTSCTTGTPPLIELSRLEDAGKAEDGRFRFLFSAEGITFMYYITGRYGEDGLHRLLTEYNRGITLPEAAEKAFGISFADLERGWRELVEKTAAKVESSSSELARIRGVGYPVDKAEKIARQQPYLGLFVTYTVEQYGTIGPAPTSPPEQAPAISPQLLPAQESPPTSSLLPPPIIGGATAGIIIGITKLVKKRRAKRA
jgi:hypothetical protein